MPPVSAYAPGRVELLGNHTDYNFGVVLGAAIDRGLTVRGSARSDDLIELKSSTMGRALTIPLAEIQRQSAEPWANYLLGVVAEFLRDGDEIGGFTAEVEGDLPAGGGLSSSAALEVATAAFLMKLRGLRRTPMEVAKLSQRAENEYAGVRSGLLDQATSVFGRANHAVFLDCRDEAVRTVPFPPELALVIADSGAKHNLLESQYNTRRAECFAAAAALGLPNLRAIDLAELEARRSSLPPLLYRRALHIVGENDRVWQAVASVERGDVAALGPLLNASHESSRFNFENSTPDLDLLVDSARSIGGVLGARLTGGGFGGSTVTLVEASRSEAIVAELAARFEARLGRSINPFVCRLADGAAVRNGFA